MVSRRGFLYGFSGLGLCAAGSMFLIPDCRLQAAAQNLTGRARGPSSLNKKPFAVPEEWAEKLISAAESRIGKTVRYDPAYVGLAYPMGDVPDDRGVCTDVVIRAYRHAHAIDLQRLVHEDMRKYFSAYPKTWGLKRPDRNIDHRRVPNLERYFVRKGAALPVTRDARDYKPGDLVSQRLPGNLPHIGIVTHRPTDDGKRPLIVHNIGAGARLEDVLFKFSIKGHFRFVPRGAG